MTLIYMVQLVQMLAFLKTFTLTLQLRFLVGWVKKCWPISYLSGHSCANTKTKGFTEEIASTTQFCVGHFFKYRQKTKGFSEESTCTMHLPPPSTVQTVAPVPHTHAGAKPSLTIGPTLSSAKKNTLICKKKHSHLPKKALSPATKFGNKFQRKLFFFWTFPGWHPSECLSLSPLPLETSPQRLTINGPDRGDEMIQKLYKSITVVSTFNMKLWNIYPTTAEHQQLVFWIILHFSSL